MSAERRQAMIREIETAGFIVETREERGLLIVTVSDARGRMVVAVPSTHRFDIEGAYRHFNAWQARNQPRGISRIPVETRKSA